MNTSSLLKGNLFKEDKPNISIMLETESSKEIKILMDKGHVMKKHQTPFPIIIEIFDGSIEFGVDNKKMILSKGDLINLDGGVPHDLLAIEKSIIRLSLSKLDSLNRVKEVIK